MNSKINNSIAKSFEKLSDSLNSEDKTSSSSKGITDADKNKFQELISKKLDKNLQSPLITEKTKEQLTLGDKVLQGIHGIGSKIENQANAVKMELNGAEKMDIQAMLKTQLAMSNLVITQDYTSKIVSKATQAFDTLLKNQ